MTTLQDAIKAIETLKRNTRTKKSSKNIADELLGKFKGVIPKGKTSTQYIRELRETGYGKFK